MDSHLIAGAYSHQFLAVKDDESLINSDRLDAIARAKRLSQETNRRRKLQANKRKLQAKREEKRRFDILTRRRDEQRQATEKYQRSHLPPSARQSYRFVQRRPDGATLDDAMQLIRGVPHYNRYTSSLERILSEPNENKDPMEMSFNRPRPHSTRPGSGRLTHQLNFRERAELMNNSQRNMTASKTLFEEMLKQQQSLLLEQQQQSLQEFNHALHHEIDGERAPQETANPHYADSDSQDSEGNITHSNSCSSLDSLEESHVSDPEYARLSHPRPALTQLKQRPASAHHVTEYGQNFNHQNQFILSHQPEPQLQQQRLKDISLLNEQKVPDYPQNQNMFTFEADKKNAAFTGNKKAETKLVSAESVVHYYAEQQGSISSNGFINHSDKQRNMDTGVNQNNKLNMEQNSQMPMKQISIDSLESCSSNSSMPAHNIKDGTRDGSRGNGSLYSEGVESRNNVHNYNSNVKNLAVTNAETNKQYTDKLILPQRLPVSSQSDASSVLIQPGAWTTPSTLTNTTTYTNFPSSQTKLNGDHFQPRYASAIGVTVLPNYNAHDQIPTTVYSTTPSATAATSLPSSSVANYLVYPQAGARVDAVARLDTFGSISNNDTNKTFANVDKLGLTNLHINNYYDLGNIHQSSNQNQVSVSPLTKQMNAYQMQIKVPSNPGIPEDSEESSVLPTGKQTKLQVATAQHITSGASYTHANPLRQAQIVGAHTYNNQDLRPYHTQQLNNDTPDTCLITPALGKNPPTSRPPSPVVYPSAKVDYQNKSGVQTGPKLANNDNKNEPPTMTADQTSVSRGQKDLTDAVPDGYAEDEVPVDEDNEEMRPLRGILKQTAVKITPQERYTAGKTYPRDSLELVHGQNGKKNSKKSVRFANELVEEDGSESDDAEQNEWSYASLTGHKNATNRPLSAKFASVNKPEISTRVQRAFSAGSLRQEPLTSENIQVRNIQQISSSSAPANTVESTSAAYSIIHWQRSNLPPSFVSPLNTTPINRPKAAAHIIMSTDIHKEASIGYDTTHTVPSTIHKSQLETKIRAVNNNFMSKVPVKIPTSKESNAVVYNVTYAHDEENANNNTNASGTHAATEDIVNQKSKEWQQQQNVAMSRNSCPGTTTTTATAQADGAPALSKVTYTQSHVGKPSFPTSAGNAVYDETGVRIDRTPTDEEITWLWDKVRNCLNKESGNKSQTAVNGNVDQARKQPPLLSTKLIDGAALGVGTCKNGDIGSVNVVRPAVFSPPRAAPTLKLQNTISPVVQQQGGYLRRYGLLKQRRASSASAVRSNNGPESQKAVSVSYGRTSTLQPHQPSSATSQPQQRDIPTPMAYSYKPQDEVSESTAAFLMAERLAKQSLSDSHIQVAMDDAHSKQEAYNRSKMTDTRRNGHSALSLEEHRLLESLDRLNEKLKESKFNGTIHYHQHNQAQTFM